MADDFKVKFDFGDFKRGFDDAIGRVKSFGENLVGMQKALQYPRVEQLTLKLREARKIFEETGKDVDKFRNRLKTLGISQVDARLLTSKMSSELNQQRRAVLGLDGFFARLGHRLGITAKQIWVVSHALNIASKGYGVVKTIVGGVSGIVSSIGGKAVELGKGLLETVVETATFQESTIKGLTTTFKGNEGTAKSVYDYALGLAKKTPLETDYIITSIRTLVETGGFDVSESKYLVKAVADIASKYGGDEGLRIGEQLTTNLSRVRARGYATTRDIGESLLAAKISPAEVAPELAKILKIKEKDPLKQTVAVREALSHAGKIGANDFINALTASLEKKAPLGEYAEKQSQTWGGVISNLKAAFTDLLKSADLSRWPGLKSLKDFFLRVTHVFDPVEGAGKEILGTVDRVLGNILGGLDKITEKDIVGFVETIGDVAETIATGIQKVWGWLDRLLHSGSAAGAVDELGDILVDVGAYIGAGIWQGIKGGRPDKTEREYGVSRRGAEAAAKYQGRSVADVERDLAAYKAAGGAPVSPGIFSKFGFNPLNSDALKNTATIEAATQFAARQRQGTFSAPSIQDLVGEAYGTGQNLALGMIQGAKDAGEIRSPSRKMMRLGENLVQGAVQGFDKASDQATKNGGGGGVSLSVTMPLVVMGSVDDPDQLAGALEAPVTKLFTSMMERLASEYGYARA